MAIKTKVTSVTATAAAISSTDTDITLENDCIIRNMDAAKTLYIGAAGVTSANGFPVAPLASLELKLRNNEVLYGIGADAGPIAVRAFQTHA